MGTKQELAINPVKTMQPHPDYERFVRDGELHYFIWQVKHDGARMLFDPVNRQFYSRNGKVYPNFDALIPEALALHERISEMVGYSDFHLDGEIAGKDFTAVMEQLFRKSNVDVSGLKYHVFDFTAKPHVLWTLRNSYLRGAFSCGMYQHLCPVESYPCPQFRTVGHLERFVQTLMDQGFEGCVFKNIFSPYCFGAKTPCVWVKGVLDETVDLKVEALVEGTGKLEGRVGAFICSYNGRPVEVAPGRATHEELERWWKYPEETPTMIEVIFKSETKDGSLRHPRFKRRRDDK